MVAVVAVMAIVSAVLLASNSKFGGHVLLENLAYDMAMTFRQAQVYGISVQRFGTNIFTAGYGIHADTSNPYTYVMFADACTIDGIYNPLVGGCTTQELVQTTSLERGFKISKLCSPAGTNSVTCVDGSSGTSVTSIDILFKRPDPDAWISAAGNSCILVGSNCVDSARIVVYSPRGDQSSILIESNGQITVQK